MNPSSSIAIGAETAMPNRMAGETHRAKPGTSGAAADVAAAASPAQAARANAMRGPKAQVDEIERTTIASTC